MNDEIILPAEGLPLLLDWMLKSPISGVLDLQLLLFSNAISPDCNVTLADLVECSFPGYSRVTLNRSNWQTPSVVVCCGITLYGTTPVSWTNTGSATTVAGYAFLYPAGNLLVAVQALGTPILLQPLGTLGMRPQFTLTTGACPP